MSNKVAAAEELDSGLFMMTLLVAVGLHVVVLLGWQLLPKARIVDVPVRTLNIKLGDGDEPSQEEMKAIQSVEDNAIQVEDVISRMVHDDLEQKTRAKAVAKSVTKTAAAPADNTPALRQFVREENAQVKGNGSQMGNSRAQDAEMMSRYEQLISLWIQKFKQYPEAARAQVMQGETVVRIRIDRRGNIGYYALERSTGFQLLDHAAIDMIRRANPVPAVPNDYPEGDMFEFLIPVNFNLQ